MMKVGSLFSGIGGLDYAINEFYECETYWFCENDVHCQLVLDQHFDIPIVPDIREIDEGFEKVDILHGGYPCQPFSTAGYKKGLNDERNLWPEYARVIGLLEPNTIVLENVQYHLKLGFNTVLKDLAEMGYDVRWGIVRACDAGAPHRRARLFALAHSRFPRAGWNSGETLGIKEQSGWVQEDKTNPLKSFREVITDSNRKRFDRRKSRIREGWRQQFESYQEFFANTYSIGQQRVTEGDGKDRQMDFERWFDSLGRGEDQTSPDSNGSRQSWDASAIERMGRSILPTVMDKEIFGEYKDAIERWEYLTEVEVPYPIDEKQRLSPYFVEWMMGFPLGYTEGLARTNQLKVLGNAIVPQQAYLALELLND